MLDTPYTPALISPPAGALTVSLTLWRLLLTARAPQGSIPGVPGPAPGPARRNPPLQSGPAAVQRDGSQAPGRAFLLLLRPQATESDKNYLQTSVTKSPFPPKGPSNLKVPCKASCASFLQSLP